jgi:GxxExxY protein
MRGTQDLLSRARESIDALSKQIVEAAVEVQSQLGLGLEDQLYRAALCRELELRNLRYEDGIALSFPYKGMMIEYAAILDVVVDGRIMVAVRADEPAPMDAVSLRSYLRVSRYDAGILINFDQPLPEQGIERVTRPS